MKTIEKAQNTKENIEALEKQIDDNSKIGLALLWVLDDAPGNTNAYRVTVDAAAELAALREAMEAEKRQQSEETEEFNAGYDAALRGEPIDNEPSNTPYDVWCIGWVWGDYQKRKVAKLETKGD
jgi:hypothetical protein